VRPAFDQGEANEALVSSHPRLAAIAVALITTGVGFSGPAGSGDAVYGGGRHAGPTSCSDGSFPVCFPNSREFSLDAHANRPGGAATGTLEYGVPETGTVLISGDVTCLAADGDRAVVGGRLNEGEFAGSGWLMQLDDRARPAAATRGRVSPVFLLLPEEEPAGFPRRCPPFDDAIFEDIGLFSQTYGDVAVVEE
jgi:hypothetical protein